MNNQTILEASHGLKKAFLDYIKSIVDKIQDIEQFYDNQPLRRSHTKHYNFKLLWEMFYEDFYIVTPDDLDVIDVNKFKIYLERLHNVYQNDQEMLSLLADALLKCDSFIN